MPKRDRSKQPPSLVHVVNMANMTTLPGLGEEVYKVASIMFHPNDAAARKTFIASALVDMARRQRTAGYLPHDTLIHLPSEDISILGIERLLDEAMPLALEFKVSKDKAKDGSGYTGNVIAAAILARAIAASEQGNDELGIAQIISDQGEEYRREGVKGVGRDNLTKVWQEYRASAHIALACFEMGSGHRMLEDPAALFKWVARSEDLLKAGNAIGNRFAERILPEGECWSLLWRPSFGG